MKFKTFFIVAIVLQFLTGLVHALSFLSEPVGTNDQEKMLIDLMNTYRMDLGAGYHRTMGQFFTALSACFTLVYLLGGLINWYLLRQRIDVNVLRGVIVINVAIFGFSFALMVIYTFLPPIVLTGLTFLALCITLLTMPKYA